MSNEKFGSVRVANGKAEVSFTLPIVEATASEESKADPPQPQLANLGDARRVHSPDFGSVRWDGELYTFSPMQRIIIAALWEAREAGYEFVSQEHLLELAESNLARIRDLFRDHPAWGKLVISAVPGGPPGAYRLAE